MVFLQAKSGDIIQLSKVFNILRFNKDALIIELKYVDKLNPVYRAQLLTYMKLSNKRIGLLINFNTKLLRNGIKRYVLFVCFESFV